MDEELLQDFLVEAGEILEQLNEQLVDLEQSPDDMDLLNAVFRGFHTIKGGAGFLSIDPMVAVCHRSEDLFNLLRNGERHVNADLMDTVLPVLDVLNDQFDKLREGEMPEAVDPALLAALEAIVTGEAAAPAPVAEAPPPVVEEPPVVETPTAEAPPVEPVSPEPVEPVSAAIPAATPIPPSADEDLDGINISDEEFQSLLDALQNPDTADIPAAVPQTPETPATATQSDEINDEEFDQLLDELHGKGKFSPTPGTPAETPASTTTSSADPDGDITDAEFEQILDNLHGKGQFSAAPTSAVAAEPKVEQAVSTPAATATAPASDEISEEEFDELLDKLHGKGNFAGAPDKAQAAPAEPLAPPVATTPPAAAATPVAGDEISEQEFDDLLDKLHGKGKFITAPATEAVASQTAAPTPEPAPQQVAPAPESAPPQVAPVASTEAVKPVAQKTAEPPKPAAAKEKEKSTPQAETTVRVDTKRLDDIMNMVGELVLVRNRIDRLGSTIGDEEMIKAVSNLDLVTTDLQMSVMKTRMQPIKKVFGRFPRVVRDIARSLKKEIKLEMEGEDTDLDKNLVDALADPLVHLVRNAVDHGIEMPDEREKAGKPREGLVTLKAEQEGDHILLTIEDNGKGMDPEKLKQIAIDKGVLDADAAARMDDHDAYNLIFAPGFSTKEEISDISGRGVGMDVVKTRITQLNGTVDIDSELGVGSKLMIKLPLTLAIMPTLMVQLQQQLFALPLVNVNEIFHLDLTKTNVVDGQLCVVVRGRTLPLFYLSRWLVRGYAGAELPQEGHVVVVHVGNQKVGFVVDELIGQEEVVIKPLGALLQGTMGLAGATITGDGGIAIILDVPGLLHSYARHAA
ncbi:MAG: chemotaxis protein CheA [Gammaproteobacteria bacterium]|nr:chemotaxis protein CheA [Gammaproteobacteria bacterium]